MHGGGRQGGDQGGGLDADIGLALGPEAQGDAAEGGDEVARRLGGVAQVGNQVAGFGLDARHQAPGGRDQGARLVVGDAGGEAIQTEADTSQFLLERVVELAGDALALLVGRSERDALAEGLSLTTDLTAEKGDPKSGDEGHAAERGQHPGESAGRPPGRPAQHLDGGRVGRAQADETGIAAETGDEQSGFNLADGGQPEQGTDGRGLEIVGDADLHGALGSLQQKRAPGGTFEGVAQGAGHPHEVPVVMAVLLVARPRIQIVERRHVGGGGGRTRPTRDELGIDDRRAESVHRWESRDGKGLARSNRRRSGEAHGERVGALPQENTFIAEVRGHHALEPDATFAQPIDAEGQKFLGGHDRRRARGGRGGHHLKFVPAVRVHVGLDELAPRRVDQPGGETGDTDAGVNQRGTVARGGLDADLDHP